MLENAPVTVVSRLSLARQAAGGSGCRMQLEANSLCWAEEGSCRNSDQPGAMSRSGPAAVSLRTSCEAIHTSIGSTGTHPAISCYTIAVVLVTDRTDGHG